MTSRPRSACETALQLDRLVFASAAGGGPGTVDGGRVTAASRPAPSTPTVEVVRDGRTRMRVPRRRRRPNRSGSCSVQSENAGWRATTDGATLGPRRLVDGYANGWLVDPTTDESFDVVLEWTPQRSVWAGLVVSLAAVLGCLAIVAVTWWRRRAGALALVTAPAAADSQVSIEWPRATSGQEGGAGFSPVLKVLIPVAVGVVGAVISAPWIGVVGAITVASAMRWRFARVVLAVLPALLRRRRGPVHRGVAAPVRHPTHLRMADRVPARPFHGLARARAARRQRGLGDRSTGDSRRPSLAAVTSSPSTPICDLSICRHPTANIRLGART